MHTQPAVLARIIHAIGDADFAAIAADSVLGFAGFDLATVVQHRHAASPALIFDNFDAAGGRRGIENYLSVTHTTNPILRLATQRPGAFRASDFTLRVNGVGDRVKPYLVQCADEELGFRTVGWPEKLEEIGLYFDARGGVVEFSLYRERGREAATAEQLETLAALRAPIAAAFDKHITLALRTVPVANPFAPPLSPREVEIADLLLLGCGSEAIALRLNISRHTVKDHRKQIFRKLGISSLAELFALHRQRVRYS